MAAAVLVGSERLQYILNMRFQIRAHQVAEGVWLSELSEADLAVVDQMAKPAGRSGDVSVLMLTEPPGVEEAHVLVAPQAIKVLNRGGTRRAVMVLSLSSSSATDQPVQASAPGDNQFLCNLPSSLRQLGTRLLSDVRKRWPGSLQSTPSGRFVDAPDNFWTVKIQPRDGSFRITVRGEPSTLHADPALNVKRDRPGYSTFKICELAQVEPTMDVLARARRR
jgi:hypothetical protein